MAAPFGQGFEHVRRPSLSAIVARHGPDEGPLDISTLTPCLLQ
jgi:hypothetical protein